MVISIQTNLGSMYAQRAMATAQSKVQTGVDRLSSGLRINNANDDAAGLAISARMTSHIRTSAPLMRGMNDGVSVLQVAGGGLRTTLDALQRSRELAVQAAHGVLTPSDRESLDKEYQQMMAQVNYISNNTEIFDIFPLKGDSRVTFTPPPPDPIESSNTPHIGDEFSNGINKPSINSGLIPIAYIPRGATDITLEINGWDGAEDDIQIFTTDGKHLVGTPISDQTWIKNGVSNTAEMETTVFKVTDGFSVDAKYDATHLLDGSTQYTLNLTGTPSPPLSSSFNGMKFTYTGDADYFDGTPNNADIPDSTNTKTKEFLHIDQTTEPLVVIVSGKGIFDAKVSWGSMPAKGTPPPAPTSPPSTGLHILTSATPGLAPTYVTIEKTPTDTKNLGLVGSALHPLDEAIKAISALDAAIDKVSGYAALHGSVQARLESAIDNAQISSINTSAARGRIMDADYAMETANLSANMIRQSSSTAMQAQAKLSAKMVLSLLGAE